MKSLLWRKVFLFAAVLTLSAGCNSIPRAERLSMSPVVPRADEEIVRDQLIIVVDETGSLGSSQKYHYEKGLVQAFTEAMPDGTYVSGIDSFAGVSSKLWLRQPLTAFNRGTMTAAANELKPLGSLTPLARSIRSQAAELDGIGGRGAILIFSDGRVRIPDDVVQACMDIEALHGGELCVFVVQIGHSERGSQLLKDAASVTSCGKYYDGNALDSTSAMESLVRDIFFGTRAIVPAPPTPAPTPVAIDWTIKNIEFDNDSSVVAASYDGLLNEAVQILQSAPGAQLRLEGHTDFNASDTYNQGLSERRVNAVKAALIQRGAAPERLSTGAFGEQRPTVPNDSPEHLHRNRRVELNVLK